MRVNMLELKSTNDEMFDVCVMSRCIVIPNVLSTKMLS